MLRRWKDREEKNDRRVALICFAIAKSFQWRIDGDEATIDHFMPRSIDEPQETLSPEDAIAFMKSWDK